MKDVIFINSHPIQYFAPMYKYMNEQGVPTKAWYCSDESIKGGFDKQFGVNVKWDIPLLEGYEYRFFKNSSWKPSTSNGFFGLINLGMITELFRIKRSVLIVHGWHYFTHMFIILLGRLLGHTVCIRNDMPLSHEAAKRGIKQKVKKIGLKYFLFPRINYFLYIGLENKNFYKSYDLPEQRLKYIPYCVDNARFRSEFERLKPRRTEIRKQHGIKVDDKVIIYSGKYIDKKRPLDLINAFIQLNDSDASLVMIGEGELRNEMEILLAKHPGCKVFLTGFINQSAICEYYTLADVIVMCSSYGENWGLSINEAMNFNLPLVLSDLTGCSRDLVIEGDNGFVFETGNVSQLKNKLQAVLHGGLHWSTPSEIIIEDYSYSKVVKNISEIV